jgi:hypothetical protein
MRLGPQARHPAQGARRPRTGCYRRRWSRCGVGSPELDDGDHQMVAILAAVLSDGLPAVEPASTQGAPNAAETRTDTGRSSRLASSSLDDRA